MTKDDDPEAFLNAFERMATVARWPETQWAVMLIPCLIGPAEQAMDTLPTPDLGDYKKDAILQTLNLTPEAYRRCLCEIEFGPDYHPRLIELKMQAAYLMWLRPKVLTKEQTVKAVCIKHYTALLRFKPQKWVTCHQLEMSEEAIVLMEVYMAAEA